MTTFEYDLLQCEERVWHSWENFTETLTQDFRSWRKFNPHSPVKIIFNYTCEGTMWLVEGDIFYKAIHNFAKKYKISKWTKTNYKWIKTDTNGSKLIKTDLNGSKRIKMNQNG